MKINKLLLIHFIWFGIYILLMGSCSSLKTIKPPFDKNPVVIPEPEVSNIRIPLKIDVNLLVNNIDSSLLSKFSLLNNWNCAGDNCISCTISKTNLKFSIVDNNLNINSQLNCQVKYGRKLFGKIQPLTSSRNIPLNLNFNTSFDWQNSWQLIPNTASDPINTNDNSKDLFNFSPLLTSKVKELVDKKLPLIDRSTEELLDIKSKVESVWDVIQAPIQVNNGLWFSLNPDKLCISQCHAHESLLSATLGIQCLPNVQYNTTKPVYKTLPLPELKINNDTDSRFYIALLGGISYEEANKLIKENLKNKSFNFGSYHVNIDDVDLSGEGRTMIIQVKISGSAKGSFYFIATPYFDTDKQLITIQNFDYSLNTKNVLLKSASWILHSDLKDIVGSKLKFSIKDQLTKAQKDLSLALNRKLSKNIVLSGNIASTTLSGLYLTNSGISVIVVATGNIQIMIE